MHHVVHQTAEVLQYFIDLCHCHWQSMTQQYIQMVTSCGIKLVFVHKLHLFLGKSTKTAATRAAVFDSNMHQIVCRLGLRRRPHWGILQRSPDPFSRPTSESRIQQERGRVWEKREGMGKGRGGEGVRSLPYERKTKVAVYGGLLSPYTSRKPV